MPSSSAKHPENLVCLSIEQLGEPSLVVFLLIGDQVEADMEPRAVQLAGAHRLSHGLGFLQSVERHIRADQVAIPDAAAWITARA